jgi:hypothetical protein
MVKYNKSTNTFQSMYKEFKVIDVTPNMCYGWIREGVLSVGDFKLWLELQNKELK